MNKINKLKLLRNKINYIDKKIISLLSQRQSLSIDIVKKKINYGLNIRDKKREMELFKKLKITCKKNNIDNQYINKLFNIIINDSVIIQKLWNKKINKKNTNKEISKYAFLGPKGSYSHLALNILLKNKKKFLLENECFTFKSVIDNLNNNYCQFALLPIENNIAGIIPETYKILEKENIFIIQELYIYITHSLLALEGCYFSTIEQIYSHKQPFQQCSKFIKNFLHWKIYYTNSTSEAMKKIFLTNNKKAAVIGNKIGGKLYNLTTIAKNLSNTNNNITRFILLSKKKKIPLQNILSKTTLLIEFKITNICLEKIILIFKKNNINISKIIPLKNTKYYINKIFFLEINSHIYVKEMQNSLNFTKKIVKKIKILGSYPLEKNIMTIK